MSSVCTSPCATCTTATACTSCVANYRYDSSGNTCIPCQTGTYSEGGTVSSCSSNTFILFKIIILGCVSPCESCISETGCSSCVVNYSYDSSSSTCVSCPSGTYSGGGTATSCTGKIQVIYNLIL